MIKFLRRLNKRLTTPGPDPIIVSVGDVSWYKNGQSRHPVNMAPPGFTTSEEELDACFQAQKEWDAQLLEMLVEEMDVKSSQERLSNAKTLA